MESKLLSASSSKLKRHIKQLPLKKARMRQDWAHLPSDLLPTIAQKASTTNMQYVHLRAVCKTWRQALNPHPHHLPPQVPWLILPRLPKDICQTIGVSDSNVSFFDLNQSKTHQFQLPYISGKDICGSSHGWLVLENHHRMSLFNPLTRIAIDLPSLDAPPTLLTGATSDQIYLAKASLSCSPSKSKCVVVAWFLPPCNWELGFCCIGDTYWTGLKKRDRGPRILDFTFHNNSVYTVNYKMEISAYDLQNFSVWTFPSKLNFYNRLHDRINLVEGDANSEGPLVVRTSEYLRKPTIYAYKWCHDQQIWQRVKDIGERALFLNSRHSINLPWEGSQGNVVYYDVRHSSPTYYFRVGIKRASLRSGKEVPGNSSPMNVFQ